MEDNESNNNNNTNNSTINNEGSEVPQSEGKPKPLPNAKKMKESLFLFSESMPNLLSYSPRTSGSTDAQIKTIISPRITEDHSGNPITLEMYSPELVFKKTPDGETHISLENVIIEGDLSPRNYWQELSTEPPEAEDQEEGGKNFFRKLRTKSITLTKRALKALDLEEKGLRKSDDFLHAKRASVVGSTSATPSTPENRDRSKSKSMDTKNLSPFKKKSSLDKDKERRISEAPQVVKPIKRLVTTPTKERSPSRPDSPKVQRAGAPPPLRWTDVRDPRVKKFEEPDDETNVQMTDVNEKQIISACTLEKLMQKLTLDGYPSADLINSFLLTYRQFLSPRELFNLVELRWNSHPPPGMDIDDFKSKKLLVIRFKVFNLLKGWIEKGFNEDFKDDNDMLEMLSNFIERMSADGLPKESERLQDILQKKIDGESSEPISNQQCPKRIIVPLLSLVHVSILNFHPEEFARQITLLEQQYFRKILPKELLGLSWTKKDKEKLSPNVVAMTHFSNHFVSMMANEVLRAEDLRTRILVFNRIIAIGMYFLKLGNFNGVFETHSALLSRSVYRMKNTWNCLPEESWTNFQKLKQITRSDNNYKNYREALNQAEPPRLPYIGRYLSDFLFMDEKYPDRLPNTELINFGKMQSLAGILQNIKFNQGHRYWFEEVEKIQDYIKNYEPLDSKQMYALSLKREPREAASNAASAPTSPRGIRSHAKDMGPASDHSDSSANSSMSNSLNSMNESYGTPGSKKNL